MVQERRSNTLTMLSGDVECVGLDSLVSLPARAAGPRCPPFARHLSSSCILNRIDEWSQFLNQIQINITIYTRQERALAGLLPQAGELDAGDFDEHLDSPTREWLTAPAVETIYR
jgi:hypothetical protein